MENLTTEILRRLEIAGTLNSLTLSKELEQDHQKIVGAIKSLQTLGDGGMVKATLQSKKATSLTDEGHQVLVNGSHEALVWGCVPDEGVDQKTLMEKVGTIGKVGFAKAMQAGWISIDKSDPSGPRIRKTTLKIEDGVQAALRGIAEMRLDVEDKTKAELKKRKLLVDTELKFYEISKGPSFGTVISEVETDLTGEMLQDGSWQASAFKSYNFNALGIMPASGHLHPLLKVRSEFRQIFLEMGFTEMPTNNFVESSFWNFDALFQPQQHPARDAHDTFFLSDPATSMDFPQHYLERVKKVHSEGGFGSQGYQYQWKIEEAEKNLLRTHTTAVSARMLYQLAQKMGFGSVREMNGQQILDSHLAINSYVEGVSASQSDNVIFESLLNAGFEPSKYHHRGMKPGNRGKD